jgi:hypothetical protein
MPEFEKFTLHHELLDKLRPIVARYPHATVTALADGAKENWRIVDEIEKALRLPTRLRRQVDFYHAADHRADGLKAGACPPTERSSGS